MDARRWARVNEVFGKALELKSEAARERYLSETCGTDAELRKEVQSLLDADAKARESFLETPAGAKLEQPVTEIGPWRVVRELGRGGMGTVYLAERADGAFTMQAALKLLRRGLDTDDLLARFRDERQILAAFEHPNIARLLDGGATIDGRPWLAMEFVEGETLTDAAKGLDLAGKLALFRKLTDAVQYAHRNLVVHRDLKPGNVLVTKSGEPKLLDFGIAKVLDRSPGEQLTKTGEMVLTPAYASPEQVRGERVTTAADVWALGVILYELLTGKRPFDGSAGEPAGGRGSGVTLANQILEGEMPSPKLGADLDAILFTALRKEPAQRYPSVEAFAEDLDRLKTGLTLRARPATFGYRFSTFVRRNRLAVGAGALIGLSLTGGVVTTTIQAREAQLARQRAEASRARAEELVDFMLGDLRHKLEPTSRLDVLEDVSKAVQTYFDTVPAAEQSPERRVRTLNQLATVKLAQAKTDEAIALLDSEKSALESLPHDVVGDELRAMASQLRGQALEAKGDLDHSLVAFQSAAAIAKTVLDRRPVPSGEFLAAAAEANNDVGRILYSLGKYEESGKANDAAWDTLQRFPKVTGRFPDECRAKTRMYGGRAKEALGKLQEAEGDFRENLKIARELRATFPADNELDDYMAISLNDLGRVVRNQGRPGEAEPLAEEAVQFSAKALARDPENANRIDGLSASHSFLGRAREELGKLGPALEEFRADVALSEKLLTTDPENALTQAALADGLTNVGRALRKMNDLAEARKAHLRALALREGLAAKDESFKVDIAISKLELGRVQRLAKEDPKASFEAALVTFKEVGGTDDAPAKMRGRYAQTLIELGRVDEAKPIVKSLIDAGSADADLKALAAANGM
ncbi:MAG: protein kinase [Archangium sp.]|nr:protein kinase [Archangium sp.]